MPKYQYQIALTQKNIETYCREHNLADDQEGLLLALCDETQDEYRADLAELDWYRDFCRDFGLAPGTAYEAVCALYPE